MIEEYKKKIDTLINNVERVFLGKTYAIKLCVVGVLARGHILIEDVPGMGETTLAQVLARSMNCKFHRIQFTTICCLRIYWSFHIKSENNRI